MSVKKIIQFGYNVRVPDGVRDGTIPVVDCRVLPNPYPKYAHDRVAARYFVAHAPEFPGLVAKAVELAKKHPVIAVGCGYGVHRSGLVVEHAQMQLAVDVDGVDVDVENIGKA